MYKIVRFPNPSITLILPIYSQNVRQEYMDVESSYQERRNTYDKVAVGLDLEKQKLEKDAGFIQVRVETVC